MEFYRQQRAERTEKTGVWDLLTGPSVKPVMERAVPVTERYHLLSSIKPAAIIPVPERSKPGGGGAGGFPQKDGSHIMNVYFLIGLIS
jgi:hypothetical protein